MTQENKNEKNKSSFVSLPLESELEKTIHTMEDDLKDQAVPLAHPPIQSIAKEILPQKEKENPFLNKESWDKKKEKQESDNSFEKKEKIDFGSNFNKKEVLHLEESENKKKDQAGLGGVVIFAIVTAVLIISIISGYYFWMTRLKDESGEILPENSQESPQLVPESQSALPDFSQDNANFIRVDIDESTSDSLREVIQENADKLAQSGIVTPVEFTFKNNNDAPVKFGDFARKIGLNFSQTVGSLFGDDFSLFIYNDNGNIRLGLAVSLIAEIPKAIMIEEEKNLIQGLSPLYLGAQYSPSKNTVFNSSVYNGRDIRYVNVISPEDLSIDYFASEDVLVIGTTKMTLRSILDYISQKKINNAGLEILDDINGGNKL